MMRLKRLFPYLLLAPAVLPLVYISDILYPYVTPKTFLLQGGGIIALTVFVYLALSGQPFFYGRLRNWLSWVPAALLAVAYATSFLGTDFSRSFWGLFDRGDGLLTLTVITVFFYLILLFADRAFFERLVKTIAIVAGVVALIAVLQWVTAMFGGEAWFLPPVTGRIGSTFGNAAFLAGYLGMALFVILVALRRARGMWHCVYAAAAVLSVLAILFAATRGTILALLVSGSAWLAYAAWKEEGTVRRISRYGLIATILLAALFFGFRSQLANISFEPVRRIASISLADNTVASRLFVWQHIGAEAMEHPFLGYGAEHIDQLFDRVYDPSRIVEQWFDRSHNAFLDYFAQYGMFGLALYLGLIFSIAALALRMYRREPPSATNPGLLFALLTITYAVQNFFVFDTPSSLWLLYALLALLMAASSDVLETSFPGRPLAVSALVSALISLLLIPAVILPLYANILLTKGYLLHLVDVNRANANFERGLGLGTYADLEYGYQAYSMYTDHQAVQLSREDRVVAYDYAFSLLAANFKKYPYDARTATYLGHVMDTAPPEAAVDDTFNEEVLARAMTLSPLRAQGWYLKANIFLRKADTLPPGDVRKREYFREAIAVLEEYAQLEPTLPLPRYTLATLYYKLDDRAAAKQWADGAYPLYTRPDATVAGPAAKYYIAVEDWQRAVRFLADMVEASPNDYDVLYDLAKVTYLTGDRATALRIVEKLRAENPAILATDQNFLAAITEYERTRQ